VLGVIVTVRRTPDPLPALAVLGTGTLLCALAWIAPAAALRWDLHPMAEAVRTFQEAGRSVAYLGNYHAQFQFPGRLRQPLIELSPENADDWIARHPDDLVVLEGSQKTPRPAEILFQHPYLQGEMWLVRAGSLKKP
jgi:hypothetical protein